MFTLCSTNLGKLLDLFGATRLVVHPACKFAAPPEVDADSDGPEPEVSKPVAVKDSKLNFTVVRFLGSAGLVESV